MVTEWKEKGFTAEGRVIAEAINKARKARETALQAEFQGKNVPSRGNLIPAEVTLRNGEKLVHGSLGSPGDCVNPELHTGAVEFVEWPGATDERSHHFHVNDVVRIVFR